MAEGHAMAKAQALAKGRAHKKPDWLRVRMPGGSNYEAIKARLRSLDLSTVCEEAGCPNIGECWSQGTATIMILGDTCTRACRFCSVKTGDPQGFVDSREPDNVAQALAAMQLAYVVITMVDRDDIFDGGADHLSRTVRATKALAPSLLLETLVGDFQGVRADVEHVVRVGRPDVFAHNVEVVPRLQKRIRDARCSWDQSVRVLRWAKDAGAEVTKASLMVGIGESEEEMLEAMQWLRDANVDVLTVGQYLRPTPKHAPVERYVDPEEFERYRARGLAMGFDYVASGPLVRSSYRAAEAYLEGRLHGRRALTGVPSSGEMPERADASAHVAGLGGTGAAGSGDAPAPFDRYGKRRLPVLSMEPRTP